MSINVSVNDKSMPKLDEQHCCPLLVLPIAPHQIATVGLVVSHSGLSYISAHTISALPTINFQKWFKINNK